MEEAAAALASVLPTSEAHLHSLLCSQDKQVLRRGEVPADWLAAS